VESPSGAETAHWLEWQDWADPILQQPYVIKNGLLHIPEVPGVGLEWNEEAVAANLADFKTKFAEVGRYRAGGGRPVG